MSFSFIYLQHTRLFPSSETGRGEEAGGRGRSEGQGRTSEVRRLLSGEREERGVCVEDDGSRRHGERTDRYGMGSLVQTLQSWAGVRGIAVRSWFLT